MASRPRVVLTLLCRNEADIVAANIEFHISCGVDFIIATDNASTDGTTDILHSYESRNLLCLLHEPELTHDQAIWVTRMAQLATQEYAADWLIHSDADEFWCPTEGSLPDTLDAVPDHVSALAVGRMNFLPPPAGDPGGDTPFFQGQTIREICSVNSLGRPLPPKVCHRSHLDIQVDDGNHGVRRGGERIMATPTNQLEILHFPVRNLNQLERKIIQGAEALERNARIDKATGSTWRSLYRVLQRDGSLAAHYDSISRSSKQIAEGLTDGTLVEDRRIQQRLTSVPAADWPNVDETGRMAADNPGDCG